MLLLHLPLRLLLTYSNMFCIVLQESALDLTELEDALVLVKQKKQRAAPDPDFLQKVDMEITKGQNIHSSLNMIQCVCVGACIHMFVYLCMLMSVLIHLDTFLLMYSLNGCVYQKAKKNCCKDLSMCCRP